jgi:hypothetical protein
VFPDEASQSAAYDIISSDWDWWRDSGLREEIEHFDSRWEYRWQIGTNGRSGGYLVLYKGKREPSGYQSVCTSCGQLNYTRVVECDDTPEGQLRKFFFLHPGWRDEVYLTQSEVVALPLDASRTVELIRQARDEYSRWSKSVTVHNVCGVCREPWRRNFDTPHMKIVSFPGRSVDADRDYEDWDRSSLVDRVGVVFDFDRTAERMARTFVAYCRGHRVVDETRLVTKTVRAVRSLAAIATGEGDDDDA